MATRYGVKQSIDPYKRNNAGRVDQNAQLQRMRQESQRAAEQSQHRQRVQQQQEQQALSSMGARAGSSAPQSQTKGSDPIQAARGRALSKIAASPIAGVNTSRSTGLTNKQGLIRQGGNTSHNLLVEAIEKRNLAEKLRKEQEAAKRQGGATNGLSSMQFGQTGNGDFDINSLRVQGVSSEQLQNAQTIFKVGKAKGASDRDIQIALMTAFQESGLKNINYGDRDSVGLFQQRTSQGWGTVQQIMNPEYSAGKFYDDLLGRIGNKRNNMSLTQAAQAVQRSAFPNAYAKHEGKASAIMQAFAGASGGSAGSAGQKQQAAPAANGKNLGPTPVRQQLLETAFSMLGIPYAWGGGGYNNRSSRGTGKGTENVIGVDCSGLTSYVFGTIGIKLPRHSTAQYGAGFKTSINNAKPGDLIGKPGGGHVGIYIGNGQMLHSARPGTQVSIRNVLKDEFAISVKMPGD